VLHTGEWNDVIDINKRLHHYLDIEISTFIYYMTSIDDYYEKTALNMATPNDSERGSKRKTFFFADGEKFNIIYHNVYLENHF